MIQSMTGFGRSEWVYEHKKMQVEIRSLNSKNLDLNIRIPSYLKENELALRTKVSNILKRGKVDIYFQLEQSKNTNPAELNTERIQGYMDQLTTVGKQTTQDALLSIAMRLPDVLVSQEDEFSEEEWNVLLENFENALTKIVAYRTQEGTKLAEDFTLRIDNILSLLNEIPDIEEERTTALRNKLDKNIDKIENFDHNRLEQEILFYLEKLDITEEKIRLKANCDYFLEMLKTEDSNGKKLGFICQEIGREVNTLGSKANHAGMQRIVVQMKDELEKIKEQILNVL